MAYRRSRHLMLATLALLYAAPLAAQDGLLDSLDGGFGSFGGFGDAGGDPVELSSQFTPATPERPAVLMITATVAPGWHVYSINQGKLPSGLGPQETKIAVAPSDQYKLLGGFRETPEPESHIDKVAFVGLELLEHEYEVTWYAPIEFAHGVNASSAQVSAKVTLQACQDSGACVPLSAELAAKAGPGVPIGALDFVAPPEPPASASNSASSPQTSVVVAPSASDAKFDISKITLEERESFRLILLIALGGGFILNFMPCVLPVIGLKVMSFVNQAGQSRSKALALNLWYVLGILAVFWLLAAMVAFAGAAFGTLFADARSNIVLSSLVFVLALSMLGVWEIPIPGFVGHGKAQEAAQQEGAFGAFFKGVLTTILATPCTGPGVGAALGWTVKQPPALTFAVFTAIGLGMALPYIVIGAFPALARFIPKPGEWMNVFKQFLGFVLLASILWLMQSLPAEMLMPTLAFFTALGMACWLYGMLSPTSTGSERSQTYGLSAALIVGGAVLAYGVLLPHVFEPRHDSQVARAANDVAAEEYLALVQKLRAASPEEREHILAADIQAEGGVTDEAWQPFTLNKLGQATLEEGRTVIVDFGAEWCPNCKVLEATVLHTQAVDEALERGRLVSMYADFTEQPEFLTKTLEALGARGVPVVAVFPASDPYRPIVFRDGYTQSQLVKAIEAAVGSNKTRVTRGNSPARLVQ